MAVVQLELFEDPKISMMKAEIAAMKESLNKCRKKQFAEIGAMKKEVEELKVLVELLLGNV